LITEAKIEAKVVRYCREQGIYTRKFSSPAHRGVPDRVCIKNGVVVFLELKRPGNKATTLQLHEIDQLRKAGVRAFVATGFTEAKDILDMFLINSPASQI
jgi:Holliday junction resolvase